MTIRRTVLTLLLAVVAIGSGLVAPGAASAATTSEWELINPLDDCLSGVQNNDYTFTITFDENRHPFCFEPNEPGHDFTTYNFFITRYGVDWWQSNETVNSSEYSITFPGPGRYEIIGTAADQIGWPWGPDPAVDGWGYLSPRVGRAILTITAPTAPPTPVPAVPYVAVLGDSYIAGEGVPGTYIGGTAGPSGQNGCHRSKASWAYRAAMAMTRNDASHVLFVPCSGATAPSMVSGTTGLEDGLVRQGDRPQVQALENWKARTGRIDVVLLSVGGNDAGFVPVVARCAAGSCALDPNKPASAAEKSNVATYQAQALATIANSRSNLLNLVLKPIRRAAGPDATIYWLGYPAPFLPSKTCAGTYANAISTWEQQWLTNTWLPTLTRLQTSLSTSPGVGARYVDVSLAFSGHAVCSAQPFVNGLAPGALIANWRKNGPQEQIHPDRAGYDWLYQVMSRQLRSAGFIT